MATAAELHAELDREIAATRTALRTPRVDVGQVRGGSPDTPAPVPYATTGALGQDSRFSFTKAILGAVAKINSESAKLEFDALERLRKAIVATKSLPIGANPSALFLPVNWDALGDEVMSTEDAKYCKAVFQESPMTSDPDEEAWLHRKSIIFRKTQSAYTDSLGGTLVQPPTQGPVIPLVRPMAALLDAGAQTMPLPPQGRHVRPRITGAPSVQSVAESQDAPITDLTTDQLVLQAKKIAGMTRISEEATTFTSGTVDTYTKNELDRSLGLKIDAFGFYGPGGSSIPAGITSSEYSSAIINVETGFPSAIGLGVNGNQLLPQYGDYLPALIGERSFNMDASTGCWVMRPSAYASAVGIRASAVTSGDQQGPMVDILRRFNEATPTGWRSRKCVQTTNIKGTLTKGNGSNLSDVFFGIWQHCIVATYGAVQFTQGMDGNSFQRGQYLIRGVLWGDIGYEYPSAFLWYTNVAGVQGLI